MDRWLYLSLACKETLAMNGVDDTSYNIIYKRPTDLRLQSDVRICCNLLVCDMFDGGMHSFSTEILVGEVSKVRERGGKEYDLS